MTFRHALRASAPGQQESREALRGRARRAPAGSLALFLAIVGLCLAGRAWAVVLAQSTFDDPNNPYEGWIAHEWGGNDNPMQYHHTGGNPGGYIQATDINDGLDWYWMAPSEFLGNQSDAYGGTLGFDLRQRFNPGESPSQAVDNDVVLVGNGVTLVYQLGQTNWPAIGPAYPDSTGTWSVYSVPLVETDPNWHLGSYYGPAPTHDQFRSALADLGTLAVRGEYQNGADYGDLDSVALTGIGPAGFALASPANGDSVITTEPSLFWRASVATAQNDTIRYTVFWSEDPGFSPADSAAAGTDTTYAFGPSVLTIGNTYFWKVRAVDVNGFFAWSTPPEGWSFLISRVTRRADSRSRRNRPTPAFCFPGAFRPTSPRWGTKSTAGRETRSGPASRRFSLPGPERSASWTRARRPACPTSTRSKSWVPADRPGAGDRRRPSGRRLRGSRSRSARIRGPAPSISPWCCRTPAACLCGSWTPRGGKWRRGTSPASPPERTRWHGSRSGTAAFSLPEPTGCASRLRPERSPGGGSSCADGKTARRSRWTLAARRSDRTETARQPGQTGLARCRF